MNKNNVLALASASDPISPVNLQTRAAPPSFPLPLPSLSCVVKKLIEALKDLVTDANIDCTEEGLSIQAMDSSHVSLCAVALRADGFAHYRCARQISLGYNSGNRGTILKCADNNDVITLKAEDTADSLTLMFESENQDR